MSSGDDSSESSKQDPVDQSISIGVYLNSPNFQPVAATYNSQPSIFDARPATISVGCGDGPIRRAAGTEVDMDPVQTEKILGDFGYTLVKKGKNDSYNCLNSSTNREAEIRFRLSKQEQKYAGILWKPHKNVHSTVEHLSGSRVSIYVREVPMMSLRHYLGSLSPPVTSESLAKFMAAQLVEGLLFFEDHGMVHQNLKLSTALLFSNPFVLKISGFEKILKIDDPGDRAFLETKSKDADSQKFIAPELASSGGGANESVILTKTDPYRLAVLLYRIVMGRFHEETLHPGIHMSADIWRSPVNEPSPGFQSFIRLGMLASPKGRLSLSAIKFSQWIKPGRTGLRICPHK